MIDGLQAMRFAYASAAFLAVVVWTQSAEATAGVECEALDGSSITVEMNFARGLPDMPPNWLRVVAGEKGWSTLEPDGLTPLFLLQSFDDGRLLSIDLAEEGLASVAIGIRLLRVEEGEEVHEIGYVHLVGRSVHPISCKDSE
jgi:hypothetical protein